MRKKTYEIDLETILTKIPKKPILKINDLLRTDLFGSASNIYRLLRSNQIACIRSQYNKITIPRENVVKYIMENFKIVNNSNACNEQFTRSFDYINELRKLINEAQSFVDSVTK